MHTCLVMKRDGGEGGGKGRIITGGCTHDLGGNENILDCSCLQIPAPQSACILACPVATQRQLVSCDLDLREQTHSNNHRFSDHTLPITTSHPISDHTPSHQSPHPILLVTTPHPISHHTPSHRSPHPFPSVTTPLPIGHHTPSHRTQSHHHRHPLRLLAPPLPLPHAAP